MSKADQEQETTVLTTEVVANTDGNLHKIQEEAEEKEDEEFSVQQSPKLFLYIKNVIRGVLAVFQMFAGLFLTCLCQLREYLAPGLGFGLFVSMAYLLDYWLIPFNYRDLPHFPARLQYIARLCVLELFPVMICKFNTFIRQTCFYV